MSDVSFQVNDPVSVNDAEGGALEGLVAYIGSVTELEAGEWIGVRLTGKSVGKGSHNGSLSTGGTMYFECPTSCGVFVRLAQVSKRTLTRLEELRLRRELATSTTVVVPPSTSSSTAATTTPPRSSVSGRDTPPRESPMSTVSALEGTKAKREELRLRREALLASKQSNETASAAATAVVVVTSDNSAAVAPNDDTELAAQLAALTSQLQSKDDEVRTMKNQLTSLEREKAEQSVQMAVLQGKLDQAASVPQPVSLETPTKAIMQQSVEEVRQENAQLQAARDEMKDRFDETVQQLAETKSQLVSALQRGDTAVHELTQARAQATLMQNELQAVTDQSDLRSGSDAVHYKERAKLVADLSAMRRKVEQLEADKVELEATIEDVTLDKEQLQEEKEALEDKSEEMKLDLDTAQMELEELRMELQDAQATAERVTGTANALTAATVASSLAGEGQQPENQDTATEMVAALQAQNVRLREALIRLREQSTLEKMELTRQLRSVEKDVEANVSVQGQVDELTALKQTYEEQIDDLKDMVEQGAAFESMVEDLSDRVLALEEDNVALRTIVREMEEAAELTAEMEEVQAEELKALSKDMERYETSIETFKEAIKMQRRREDDFRRTIGNYKITVETLRQEKQALMELQQGGEGEKSNLVASSQKALSRAAQLVADAAESRKREAQAVMDHIDHMSYKHLSNRLECLLPHSVVSNELSAVRGELLTSKVIGKASATLSGLAASFRKTIRPPLPNTESYDRSSMPKSLDLQISDEVQQQVSTMFYQAEFAHVIIDVSSELLRVLAAGQWPDFLSPERSTELGAILGHALPDLDTIIGQVLKTLKVEGGLAAEQANVGELRLTIQATMQGLRNEIEREDSAIVPASWKPSSLELLKEMNMARFSFLGSTSALSVAVDAQSGSENDTMIINDLYNKVEQCVTQTSNACLRLRHLDSKNEKLVDELTAMSVELVTKAKAMQNALLGLLTSTGDVSMCYSLVDDILGNLAQLQLVLRAENLHATDGERHHALSPETDDAWNGITNLTRAIRAVDGDGEDVNFLLRAHAIESTLFDAVENEHKLPLLITKVSHLEKTLSSRMKEIAMQNARLSELEKQMAKSNSTPVGRGKNFDFRTSEEYRDLQEENRILTEAVDVLQREVETYENEIRALKDFKSPKKGAPGSRNTPTRRTPQFNDVSQNPRGAVEETHTTSALEATLFRPALQQALQEAARWKACATASAISRLPPLPALPVRHTDNTLTVGGLFTEDWVQLSSAVAESRLQKASMVVIDLTNRTKSPRVQLRELKARHAASSDRLETAVLRCRGRMQ